MFLKVLKWIGSAFLVVVLAGSLTIITYAAILGIYLPALWTYTMLISALSSLYLLCRGNPPLEVFSRRLLLLLMVNVVVAVVITVIVMWIYYTTKL